MDCFVAHMKGVSGVCPGCSSDHEHGIHNIQSPPEVVVKLTGDCTSSVRALLASNMCSCTIMLIILHQVADSIFIFHLTQQLDNYFHKVHTLQPQQLREGLPPVR